MRVPTLHQSRQLFDGIASRQAQQARLQSQLSSGLRVQSPGDDPVAAAQAELARSRLAHLTQDKRATDLATSLLGTADGALASGTDLLQSAREGLVAAGNAAYSDSDRQSLAQQLRATRDQLLLLANTRDGGGGFVFGGQGTSTDPVSGASAPAYGPAAGTQRIGENASMAATVDGRATFMSLPQGNGVFTTASAPGNTGTGWINAGAVANATQLTGHSYDVAMAGAAGALTYSVTDTTTGTALATNVPWKAGASIDVDGQRIAIDGAPAAGDTFQLAPSGQQSVFKTLDDAIALLESPKGARYQEGLERAQVNLDQALDGMLFTRTRIGAELRTVQGRVDGNASEEASTTTQRSNLQDLDLARGISEFQSTQTALQAALQSYSSVSRTTLFDLLR